MQDLNRIFDKIEKIDDKLETMDKSLLRNTITLEEHVRRTNLLENEVRPLKKHVVIVESIFKIIGFCATLAGIAKVLYELGR